MTKRVDLEELRRLFNAHANGPTNTSWENVTSELFANAPALLSELSQARDAIRKVRDVYRTKVITYRFGGFIGCDGCGKEWRRGKAEEHEPDCLAAPEEGEQ